jgi:hypothetical protein
MNGIVWPRSVALSGLLLALAVLAPLPAASASSGPSITAFEGVQEGQVLRGMVAITASVAGNSVSQVTFDLSGPESLTRIEGLAPYTFMGDIGDTPIGWNTTDFPDGDYTLTATASDAEGRSGSQRVRFRIGNRSPQGEAPPPAALAAGAAAAPLASASPLFTDAFDARDGTALSGHNGGWQVGDDPWEISRSTARIKSSGTSGAATVELGRADHEVACNVTLPSATAPYPQDWFAGVFARYKDGANHIRARYLYQDNSPEVEVWEIANGRGTMIDFVNLGPDGLEPGSTHRLHLVVQGSTVTVYHDGRRVAGGQTGLLDGTRAGIGVSDNLPYGQPEWDDFQAKALP